MNFKIILTIGITLILLALPDNTFGQSEIEGISSELRISAGEIVIDEDTARDMALALEDRETCLNENASLREQNAFLNESLEECQTNCLELSEDFIVYMEGAVAAIDRHIAYLKDKNEEGDDRTIDDKWVKAIVGVGITFAGAFATGYLIRSL